MKLYFRRSDIRLYGVAMVYCLQGLNFECCDDRIASICNPSTHIAQIRSKIVTFLLDMFYVPLVA